MKDKDLEFIAFRNLDFKKIEKWLIDMWLKDKKIVQVFFMGKWHDTNWTKISPEYIKVEPSIRYKPIKIMPYFKLPTKKKFEMKYKPSKEQLKEVYELLAIGSEKCLELSKQLGIYFKRLSDAGHQANKAGILLRDTFLLSIKHGKSFEEAMEELKNLSKKAPK